MTDHPERNHPLHIEAVECSPAGPGRIMLRVRGHWDDRRQIPPSRAELLVEVDGRRERFPASPVPPGPAQPGEWNVSFAMPAWVEPHLRARAFLELGSHRSHPALGWLVELPAPAGLSPLARSDEPVAGPRGEVSDAAAQMAAKILQLESSLAVARADPSRAPQMPDQLQADAAAQPAEAALTAPGPPGDAANVAQQRRIEATGSELSAELGQLQSELDRARAERVEAEARSGALTRRLDGLRAELAEATVAREAADSEAEALRAELKRLGGALTAIHEQTGRNASGLAQAEALLAEARSIRDRMDRRTNGPADPAGEA